jgi:TorA maturation chaperone TorD
MTEENGVRAGLYAVLSHLFHARPGAQLLRQLAEAESLIGDTAGALGRSWRALCAAARATPAEAAGAQFDALFVSPGMPAVSLYASSYMQGRRRGQLLAELREDLARLGFARAESSAEYEDHLAALCDVMRGLIAEEAEDPQAFERQRGFFRDYLGPWYGGLSEKIAAASADAAFYRSVACFADAFLTHETQYFDLA